MSACGCVLCCSGAGEGEARSEGDRQERAPAQGRDGRGAPRGSRKQKRGRCGVWISLFPVHCVYKHGRHRFSVFGKTGEIDHSLTTAGSPGPWTSEVTWPGDRRRQSLPSPCSGPRQAETTTRGSTAPGMAQEARVPRPATSPGPSCRSSPFPRKEGPRSGPACPVPMGWGPPTAPTGTLLHGCQLLPAGGPQDPHGEKPSSL